MPDSSKRLPSFGLRTATEPDMGLTPDATDDTLNQSGHPCLEREKIALFHDHLTHDD